MTKGNKEQTYNEYIYRINKVQDYIEANINGDLSLDTLAKISGFSKYHFCRIFRAIIKESILAYTNRIRLEGSLSFIINNPSMSVTDIAMMFGYSDSAVFARSFKNHYGFSATQVRVLHKKGKLESKNGKANIKLPRYNRVVPKKEAIKGKIEVKNIQEIKAIYLRHLGTYETLTSVFSLMMSEIMGYAMQNDLLYAGSIPFAIYHDNPEFTSENNLKTSVCLTVKNKVEASGKIGFLAIPAGKYAIGQFELMPHEYAHAWDYLYGDWLPKSGYQPDHGHVFEMYMSNPNDHPQKLHRTDIYLPVKPM